MIFTRKKLIPFYAALGLLFWSSQAWAQDKGELSGDLMVNTSIYNNDTIIGTNTTQYKHELSSSEAWLYLNYRYNGYKLSVRYDLFNNSPLLNPQEAYTHQGLGFYQVSKTFNKLGVTAGYFYDQIGSGMIFRAYEDRNLGLDYALNGLRLEYRANDSFMIKAFTGLQKYRFDLRSQVMKGVNTEKMWGLGPIAMNTGIGMINRTLDQATMNQLADQINALPVEQRFIPKYNMFAGTIYNTLTFHDLSIYTEYAKKTKEAVFITAPSGEQQLENKDGDAFYATVNYSFSGLGINLQYKKINNFIIRTSPFDNLLVGLVNFLPALSKQHSFRLPARYSISAIGQGEVGYQGEITYSVGKHSTFTGNVSYITQPDNKPLFREYYLDWNKKFSRNFRTIIGVQSIFYDQEVYQGHPLVPDVYSLTPFLEWSYRFPKSIKPIFRSKNGENSMLYPSIRMELQYLNTRQDKGDFAWGLVELNFAPKYSFTVSDMVNTRPVGGDKIVHYYGVSAAYTMKQTHLSLGYVKQVEGVVCTGGVCRVEPAFSGLRFSLTTNF